MADKKKVGRPATEDFWDKRTTKSKGFHNKVLKRYAKEFKGKKTNPIDDGWAVLSQKIDLLIKNDLDNE